MTDEYTPTTDEVMRGFRIGPVIDPRIGEYVLHVLTRREKERWLAGVKADAWDEGRKFGYRDAQAHHGSGMEGAGCGPDSWDCTCQNPYRTTGIPTTEEAAND